MADGAQSFGASYKRKTVGNIGDLATTSFFPAKVMVMVVPFLLMILCPQL